MQSHIKFLYLSNIIAILVILIEKHELNIFHFNFFSSMAIQKFSQMNTELNLMSQFILFYLLQTLHR